MHTDLYNCYLNHFREDREEICISPMLCNSIINFTTDLSFLGWFKLLSGVLYLDLEELYLVHLVSCVCLLEVSQFLLILKQPYFDFIWETVLLDLEFWLDMFLFFKNLNMSPHCLLMFVVSDDKHWF